MVKRIFWGAVDLFLCIGAGLLLYVALEETLDKRLELAFAILLFTVVWLLIYFKTEIRSKKISRVSAIGYAVVVCLGWFAIIGAYDRGYLIVTDNRRLDDICFFAIFITNPFLTVIFVRRIFFKFLPPKESEFFTRERILMLLKNIEKVLLNKFFLKVVSYITIITIITYVSYASANEYLEKLAYKDIISNEKITYDVVYIPVKYFTSEEISQLIENAVVYDVLVGGRTNIARIPVQNEEIKSLIIKNNSKYTIAECKVVFDFIYRDLPKQNFDKFTPDINALNSHNFNMMSSWVSYSWSDIKELMAKKGKFHYYYSNISRYYTYEYEIKRFKRFSTIIIPFGNNAYGFSFFPSHIVIQNDYKNHIIDFIYYDEYNHYVTN